MSEITQTKDLPQASPPQWQEEAKQRYQKSKRHPVKVKLAEDEPEKRELAYPQDQAMARLYETTGFTDTDASLKLISQTVAAQSDKEELLNSNAAMAFLNGIAPENPLEGLLAAQAVAAHNMAMEFSRRAMQEGQPSEQVDKQVSRAAKMMRAFAAQVEALQKLRNKGQQTIQVQHIQVNQGGSAIVGDVHQGAGGNRG